MSRPRRSLTARLALALAGLIVALGTAELSLRLARVEPRLFNPTGYDWKEVVVPADGLPYLFKPDSSFSQRWPSNPRRYFDPGARLVYRLNHQGFRGPDFTLARTNAARVALLGDSLAFGAGVRGKDTAAAVLESELNHDGRGPVEVYNFGLPGYNTAQEVDLFEKVVLPYRPDVALIWYFPNDADTETDLRIMRKISGGERLSALRRHSRLLDVLFAPVDKFMGERELVKGYRRAYNPKGIAMAGLDKQFSRFVRLCHDHGIAPALAIHPILYRLGPDYPFAFAHREVRSLAAKHGITVIDLLPCFLGQDAADLHVHPRDFHPNQIAQRRAAACCLPLVEKLIAKRGAGTASP